MVFKCQSMPGWNLYSLLIKAQDSLKRQKEKEWQEAPTWMFFTKSWKTSGEKMKCCEDATLTWYYCRLAKAHHFDPLLLIKHLQCIAITAWETGATISAQEPANQRVTIASQNNNLAVWQLQHYTQAKVSWASALPFKHVSWCQLQIRLSSRLKMYTAHSRGSNLDDSLADLDAMMSPGSRHPQRALQPWSQSILAKIFI